MFALAAVALGLGLTLALAVPVVLRSDALDRRAAFLALVVAVAGVGVAAQVAPGPAVVGVETAPAAPTDPGRATGTATAVEPSTVTERPPAESVATESDDDRNATVVDVLSGDRVVYRTASGTRRTVRLAGVDAPGVDGADPERFDGVLTGERGRECLADHGRRTVRHLRSHLEDETVTVREIDAGVGLPQVVLTVEGSSVSTNRRLVAGGYARAAGDRYADAERAARSGHQGVWSCGVVESAPPLRDDGRPEVRVAAVRPNPPGPDTDALNGEYIVIENVGRTTVDLGGWYVIVDLGTAYFFEERELEPGAELVIHAGTGQNTDADVYWGSGTPMLDNDHDTVRLVDGDANRTVRFSY